MTLGLSRQFVAVVGLGALFILAGCEETFDVSVDLTSRNVPLFVLGSQSTVSSGGTAISELFVLEHFEEGQRNAEAREEGQRARVVWQITASGKTVSVIKIPYGESPPGFAVKVPAATLEVGRRYEIIARTPDGSGSAVFRVPAHSK